MAQIRAMRIATISGITVTLSVAAAAYAEKSPHPVWQREGLISLAPSNTELLFDIGAGDKIAALCTNCAAVLKELRPQLVDKPTVGTFVSVNLERMTELKPRAVLLVSGQESLNSLLTRKKFQTYILPNSSLADISKNL
ncbi:MAG TPA: ABC transporter substrate-binding protein, partial [Candidatus Obscuribacterales bacterium]